MVPEQDWVHRTKPTVPQPGLPVTHQTCKLDRPRLRLMQTQVPPAPMATYTTVPPALLPLQNTQQSAAAAQGLRHQHQQLLQLHHRAGGQLGAVPVAQADAQAYHPVDGYLAPGHYNFSHDPNADLNNAHDYFGGLPSSGPHEQLLRPPPDPSSSPPVSQQPVRQTSPVCIALPSFPLLAL